MDSGLGVVPTPLDTYNNLINYLHHLSGQDKENSSHDHTYSKPWNRHPDPSVKSHPVKFLFMKDFPRLPKRQPESGDVDIVTVERKPYDEEENPLVTEFNALVPEVATTPFSGPGLPSDDNWGVVEKNPPSKNGWTQTMYKLWTSTAKILNADRLARLVCEGKPNDIIVRRNIQEKTAKRLRQLFSALAQWDETLLLWLHQTLHNHFIPAYLMSYHEAMQILRQKVPSLVDRFYNPTRPEYQRPKFVQSDSIQTVLNNHRPKRIPTSPIFLIVPNGPQIPHHFTSQRMKHWYNLFGSLGKVVNVNVSPKTNLPVSECLLDIRLAVRDKIRECRGTFDNRPLVLVGFGSSSLIAAHAALDHAMHVTATVCLGFPLSGINGFRGDLDDPLLDTSVPTIFVIGQNSSMCTLDDMEDFRERMSKATTGLVVVGGCNDKLILCGAKKRFEGLTQGMVDRCIADEIYDFITDIVYPNYKEHVKTFARSSQQTAATSRVPSTPKTPSTPVTPSTPKTPSHSTPSSATSQPTSSIPRRTLEVPGVVKRKRKYPRSRPGSGPTGGSISAPPTVPSSPDPGPVIDPPDLPPPMKSEVPTTTPTKAAKRSRTVSDSKALTPISETSVTPTTKDKRQEKVEKDSSALSLALPGSHVKEMSNPSTTPSDSIPKEVHQIVEHEKLLASSYDVAPVLGVGVAGSTRTRKIRPPRQLDM